jgi:hypothetical protein
MTTVRNVDSVSEEKLTETNPPCFLSRLGLRSPYSVPP